MGRKNRGKIKKEQYGRGQNESGDDNDIVEDYDELTSQQQLRYLDIIYGIRQDMKDYCHSNALPLCENLSVDIMSAFVDFVQENKD